MDDNKKIFYKNQAESIIKKLEKRKMEGYYCEDMAAACDKVLELLGQQAVTVGYGGSMTIDHSDLKQRITQAGHELIIRENAKTPDNQRAIKAQLVNADYFMMSTNAITLDGELVNIDGRGNRVSFLIYGPEHVLVIAGMNKVVCNVEEGLDRVRNFASPPNTVRLNCDTPCSVTGKCGHCLTNSICSQIVVTRTSMIPGRIKVILVGEDLGY